MRPTKTEFCVGATIHRQPLVLAHIVDGGLEEWALLKKAFDQRDDNQTIYGITAETILAMAQAVKQTAASEREMAAWSAKVREVIEEYDQVVAGIPVDAAARDGPETDFVMRADDYRMLVAAARLAVGVA